MGPCATIIEYGTPKRLVAEISADTRTVSAALRWLIRRQKHDGHWGEKTELGRIVSTCQAVMTLIAYHYPTNSSAVRRALTWLKSPSVRDSEYGYWRASPMLAAGEGDEELGEAIRRIKELYEAGHQFNPNFIFALYYHNLLHRAGISRQSPELAEVEGRLVELWDQGTCWNNRADNTAWAYCSLEHAGCPRLAPGVRETCASFLAQRASAAGSGNVNWEGSVVATAFVVMDIMSCSLSQDSELAILCQKATNWLVSRAVESSPPHWVENRKNLPAGGEVYDPEYATAVALRAIAAGRSIPEQAHVSQVWLADREYLLTRIRYWQLGGVVSGSLVFFALVVPYLWRTLRQGTWHHIGHVVVGTITGFVALGNLYGLYRIVRAHLRSS